MLMKILVYACSKVVLRVSFFSTRRKNYFTRGFFANEWRRITRAWEIHARVRVRKKLRAKRKIPARKGSRVVVAENHHCNQLHSFYHHCKHTHIDLIVNCSHQDKCSSHHLILLPRMHNVCSTLYFEKNIFWLTSHWQTGFSQPEQPSRHKNSHGQP